MKLAVLLLLCLVFVGCQGRTSTVPKPVKTDNLTLVELLRIEVFKLLEDEKKESTTYVVGNTRALSAILSQANVPILFSDDTYVLPTREFVNDKIIGRYAKFRRENQLIYNEKFDCDDFARMFALMANVVNDTENAPAGIQGIAVGEVWYVRNELVGKTPHAINIIITSEQDVVFFEPQTCSVVNLTEMEFRSIKMIRF